MTYVALAILVMAALVFGASAVAKLRSRGAYRRYRAAMASTGLLRAAAGWLAAAEVVVAVGLGAGAVMMISPIPGGRAVAESALGLAAMLTFVLAAGVWVLIRRGVRAQCACFGASADEPIGAVHLVRNVTLLLLVLAGLAGNADVAGPRPVAAVVMAVVAGGCLALMIIRWADLAVLVTPVSSIRRSRY